MSTSSDSLDVPTDPDRVFYELGVMLSRDDFQAEQTYHRGRLARALAFLHGLGTAAGLRVSVPDAEGDGPPQPATEEVHVAPGLAVDEVGRLIEVPTTRCLRLQRWLDAQATGGTAGATPEDQQRFTAVREAFLPEGAAPGTEGNIIVDVLIRFAACDRGKTPGFATGPFDSLNAVQPSRIRDAFEIQLAPRDGASPVPINPWPDLSAAAPEARLALLHQAILDAWPDEPAEGAPHWLYLATLSIPATSPTGTSDLPARIATSKVAVDNEQRAFLYTAAALARLNGL